MSGVGSIGRACGARGTWGCTWLGWSVGLLGPGDELRRHIYIYHTNLFLHFHVSFLYFFQTFSLDLAKTDRKTGQTNQQAHFNFSKFKKKSVKIIVVQLKIDQLTGTIG
jgi:hypothetical protein